VVQYKASYADYFFGSVNCSGVHQVNKNTTPLGQDSFTCTSTTGPFTNVSGGQQVTLTNIGGWISDYDHASYAKTFSATVSSDGMSYTAVATY
jgi:hypothetical protein